MTTAGRIQRQLEEIEDELKRVVAAIDAGNGDLHQVRATLSRLLSDQLPEADRLAQKAKREHRD